MLRRPLPTIAMLYALILPTLALAEIGFTYCLTHKGTYEERAVIRKFYSGEIERAKHQFSNRKVTIKFGRVLGPAPYIQSPTDWVRPTIMAYFSDHPAFCNEKGCKTVILEKLSIVGWSEVLNTYSDGSMGTSDIFSGDFLSGSRPWLSVSQKGCTVQEYQWLYWRYRFPRVFKVKNCNTPKSMLSVAKSLCSKARNRRSP